MSIGPPLDETTNLKQQPIPKSKVMILPVKNYHKISNREFKILIAIIFFLRTTTKPQQ